MIGQGRVSRSRQLKNQLFGIFCLSSLIIAGVLLVVLLYSVMKDGVGRLDLEFFNQFTSRRPENSGIKAALWGTIWVITLTILIAVPIGVAAAIYLEEYTTHKTKAIQFIQLNIANLAGVPSIVYGLLGLALFVRWLALDRSVLAGALTMALLILPMVILVSQEALRAVPKSYREASFALGATRWQTIRGQVLPAALPAIMTGIILSASRAMGETAPLITIGAVTYIGTTPKRLGDPFTVLPIQIFDWSSRAKAGFHEAAAAAIIVLLGVLLLLNSAAIYIRYRAQKKL